MRIGKLRHRIKIQKSEIARDEAGAELVLWVDTHDLWANVRGTRAAREGHIGGTDQEEARASYRVQIRHLQPWPDVKGRVVWDGLILDIENVIDPDGRGRELLLMCEARI